MRHFKWPFVFATITVLGISSLQGQTPQFSVVGTESRLNNQKKLATALHRYQDCLRLEVEGVVESAIFHTIILRLKAPHGDFSKIAGALQRLSFEASSPRLRYQAYLGASVMVNAEQFIDAGQREHLLTFTDDRRAEFFTLIAATLENQLAD